MGKAMAVTEGCISNEFDFLGFRKIYFIDAAPSECIPLDGYYMLGDDYFLKANTAQECVVSNNLKIVW